MKTFLKGAAVLAALLGSAAPALAQRADCNRACLSRTLDQFIKAVVARDPAKAPLAAHFRQTQNAVAIPAGEGIWKSNEGIGAVDRRYVDPLTGETEFYGTMKEGDTQAIVSARVRVENQQITEAEWHIARKGDAGIAGQPGTVLFDLDALTATPPPQRVVPPAQRSSREVLIAAVNSYFDGVTAGTGRWVQANPGCVRLENGMGVTGIPRPLSAADAVFQTSRDCRSGYANLDIVNVAARRYLLVDEEAQVVVASMVFIRAPNSPKRRNNFMEVFTMDGGKISSVHAAMMYVPPAQAVPNWPPYDGNFPLAPSLVTAQ